MCSKKLDTIEYYDRASGQLQRETVMGDAVIKWAYQTLSGKLFAPVLFGSSLLSRILGWYFDSHWSRAKIAKAIVDLDINVDEFAQPQHAFKSFNDFFTRKLKPEARPFSDDPCDFLSPADGRLLVYSGIAGDSCVKVKGVEDSLPALFGRDMDGFSGGKVAVLRLCPADYHRFHFPCTGTVTEQAKVNGKYHSVNPIALNAQRSVFCMNKRTYTLLDTERFGRLAFMEVGAFGVAGIHQTFSGHQVERMREKGYFDFGGSTIVLVFQKNTIEFSADLVKHSQQGIETLVKVGQTIGQAANTA